MQVMVIKTTSRFFFIFHQTLKGDFLNCLRRKSHKNKKATHALTSVIGKDNCLKSKRSQFKIQQMAFMLLAVTLFFVLAGVFILMFKLSSIKDTATEISEKNAQLLVIKLANSPEFSCGKVFDYSDVACIDGDKVMALKESESIYKNFWGVSDIEIRKIYPDKGGIECTSKNYPDCGVIKIKSRGVGGDYISNFVILCRKDSFEGEVYDKCEISRLMISYKPTG